MALGPLRPNIVRGRYGKIARENKKKANRKRFLWVSSVEPPFCSKCALSVALLQLQPSATARCKMDTDSPQCVCGSNVYLKVRHVAELFAFSIIFWLSILAPTHNSLVLRSPVPGLWLLGFVFPRRCLCLTFAHISHGQLTGRVVFGPMPF